MGYIKNITLTNLIFSICLFSLVGCIGYNAPRDEQLSEEMRKLNDDCPINVGMVGELANIHQEDSTFILTYNVADAFKEKAWGNADYYLNPDITYLDLVISKDDKLTSFCKSALKKGFTIKEVFKVTLNQGFETTLTELELLPSEYNKILESSIPDQAKKILRKRMELENKAYKNSLQTQSYSALNDSFYVVGHIVDQEDLRIVKLTPDNMRTGLIKSFRDPSMISFANECIFAGIGISFEYKSENDSLCINFTKDQLKRIVDR